MRAEPSEFQSLDLRCHALLADVPLHDVWAISLNGGGPNRTLRDIRAILPLDPSPPNLAVRCLFAVRRILGRVFGWDREDHDSPAESYVHRLTDEDQARSLV